MIGMSTFCTALRNNSPIRGHGTTLWVISAKAMREPSCRPAMVMTGTMVPVMTIAGLQLGSLIAFALITQSVVPWPRMGLLFLKAVQNVDIPIMSAYLLLVAFIFVTINLIVDILYAVVDPRIRIDARATA